MLVDMNDYAIARRGTEEQIWRKRNEIKIERLVSDEVLSNRITCNAVTLQQCRPARPPVRCGYAHRRPLTPTVIPVRNVFSASWACPIF